MFVAGSDFIEYEPNHPGSASRRGSIQSGRFYGFLASWRNLLNHQFDVDGDEFLLREVMLAVVTAILRVLSPLRLLLAFHAIAA